jgi:hypothetical protein
MRLQAVGMATETTITTHSGFTAPKVWFVSWFLTLSSPAMPCGITGLERVNSPSSAVLNVYCQTGNLINMHDHPKSV